MGDKEKIVMVGDYSTGKTCLLIRLTQNFFNSEHNPTIGAAFIKHTLTLSDNTKKEINLWDTSGDERFRSVMPVYFRGASCAIIVYDVTSRSSFESLEYWINLAKDSGNPDMQIVIAATKCDLSKQVQDNEGKEFASKVGYPIVFCSAYTGEGVKDVFLKAAETSKGNVSTQMGEKVQINGGNGKDGKNGGCC